MAMSETSGIQAGLNTNFTIYDLASYNTSKIKKLPSQNPIQRFYNVHKNFRVRMRSSWHINYKCFNTWTWQTNVIVWLQLTKCQLQLISWRFPTPAFCALPQLTSMSASSDEGEHVCFTVVFTLKDLVFILRHCFLCYYCSQWILFLSLIVFFLLISNFYFVSLLSASSASVVAFQILSPGYTTFVSRFESCQFQNPDPSPLSHFCGYA
jgi:hypothetical protein